MKLETALFAMAMAITALAIRRAWRVDNLTTTPRVRHFRRHHARQPLFFGAIAVETGTLIAGFGKEYSSRADAQRRAIAMCRRAGGLAADCKIAVWGQNSCLALATSPASNGGRNSWGYAWSDDGFVSRRKAMAACRKDGGANCKVAVTFCTG